MGAIDDTDSGIIDTTDAENGMNLIVGEHNIQSPRKVITERIWFVTRAL